MRPEDDMRLEKPVKFPINKYPLDEAPLPITFHRDWANPRTKPDNSPLIHEIRLNFQPSIDTMRKVSLGVEEMGKNLRRRREARLSITTSYAPTLGPGKDI